MDVLKNLHDAQYSGVPATLAEARASINSAMLFKCCVERNVESRVSTTQELLLLKQQASSINRNGPVMFK
jgi:hypothetical protein